MIQTVSKALLRPESKIMVPLGLVGALLLAYLVYMHKELAEVRRIAEAPSGHTAIMLEQINLRLGRMENLLMQRKP